DKNRLEIVNNDNYDPMQAYKSTYGSRKLDWAASEAERRDSNKILKDDAP
ncbi:17609_t:CDS:2, partial [Entrophospora sp. SA101]